MNAQVFVNLPDPPASGKDDHAIPQNAAGLKHEESPRQARLRSPSPEDGMRILVDRQWPRGLSKEKAQIDLWLRELAPCADLRKWFSHEPDKWDEFRQRYQQELRQQPAVLQRLIEAAAVGATTLLFGANETRFNDAVALREFLLAHARKYTPHRSHHAGNPAG